MQKSLSPTCGMDVLPAAAGSTPPHAAPGTARAWTRTRGDRSMWLGPVDMLEVLVRDGIPKSSPGPDGTPRPPIPLGRRVSLPGRGTTFVREVAGPPGAADVAPAPWLGGEWGPQLVPCVRDARLRVPRPRPRSAGPRARGPLDGCVPTRRLCRRSRGPPRHAGRRTRARRRLLDGRLGGPTARSPPSRSGRRPRALRDGAPVLPQACPGATDRRPARRGRERSSASADGSCTFLRRRYEPCGHDGPHARGTSCNGPSTSSAGTTCDTSSRRPGPPARSTRAPGSERSTRPLPSW